MCQTCQTTLLSIPSSNSFKNVKNKSFITECQKTFSHKSSKKVFKLEDTLNLWFRQNSEGLKIDYWAGKLIPKVEKMTEITSLSEVDTAYLMKCCAYAVRFNISPTTWFVALENKQLMKKFENTKEGWLDMLQSRNMELYIINYAMFLNTVDLFAPEVKDVLFNRDVKILLEAMQINFTTKWHSRDDTCYLMGLFRSNGTYIEMDQLREKDVQYHIYSDVESFLCLMWDFVFQMAADFQEDWKEVSNDLKGFIQRNPDWEYDLARFNGKKEDFIQKYW